MIHRNGAGVLTGIVIRVRDRIWGNEGTRKVLANAFWLALDKVIRIGMGFLVGVWVARYLGPERFGMLNYAAAWVGLFGVFATLGMDSIVVRDVVQLPEERGAILGTTFVLRVAGSIVLVIVSIGVTLIVDSGNGERQTIVVIIAASQLFRPFDTIDLWFQAIVKWKNVFLARNLAFVVSSALRIILVLKGADTIGFAWVFAADTAFAAVGLFVISRATKDRPGRWRVDWKIGKRVLHDSWPLALSSIAILIYMRIDQIMIGRMLGDAQLGIYSAAVRISEVWYFVPVAIAQSVFPSLVQAKRRSDLLYWRRMHQMCTTLVWLGLVVAVGFQIAGGWIINVLYGPKFEGAAAILRVHAWAGLFVALGVAGSSWYTLENKQRLGLIATGVSAATNVVLNIFLIPAVGAVGAAIATIISQMNAAFLVPGTVPGVRRLLWIMLRAFVPIPERRRKEVPVNKDM